MRKLQSLAIALVVLAAFWLLEAPRGDAPARGATPELSAPAPGLPAFLPEQARETLELIARDGPYPHRQDGAPFRNREGRLPSRPQGHYREYTVATPGLSHRGARRIITGGDPPREYWYTDDHYGSFRRFEVTP